MFVCLFVVIVVDTICILHNLKIKWVISNSEKKCAQNCAKYEFTDFTYSVHICFYTHTKKRKEKERDRDFHAVNICDFWASFSNKFLWHKCAAVSLFGSRNRKNCFKLSKSFVCLSVCWVAHMQKTKIHMHNIYFLIELIHSHKYTKLFFGCSFFFFFFNKSISGIVCHRWTSSTELGKRWRLKLKVILRYGHKKSHHHF